ncbi:MAG: 30S ribosomal protein S20 [Candidatus Sungbacteria bacterium]|nr:30S ribosomal protein S20 [Candidatus Sungbacteria bacterium]
MPVTKSAEKALRQSKRRHIQNLIKKEAFKEAVKRVRTLIAAQKAKEAKDALSLAYKALDKAAKTNVISKNTASRKKSRLAKLLQSTINK